MNLSRPVFLSVPPNRWFYGLAFFLCLTAAAFCLFYRIHSYDYLRHWYLGLHPDIYRKENWANHLFTAGTKEAGNRYCLAGLLLSGLCMALLMPKFRGASGAERIRVLINRQDGLALAVLVMAGMAAWNWANAHIYHYNDEVFSAVYCDEAHPFQALSYYMLPNNHILYNVANSLLFRGSSDYVFTGRNLSGIAYLLLLVLLYFWLRGLLQRRFFALCLAMTIGLQFIVWGFGAMARGYEWYLLCEWAAFIFFIKYLMRGEKKWLLPLSLATIIGAATIPTYLYFYLALVLTAVIFQTIHRKADITFWKYQAVAGIALFLFYLPAIGFSGTGAFASNNPILTNGETPAQFMATYNLKINCTLQYGYTGLTTGEYDVAALLTALPLLLIGWIRNRERQLMGLAYSLMWLVFFILTLLLHKFPPLRNLIGQISIGYGLLLLLAFWLVDALFRRWRAGMARLILVIAILAGFCAYNISMARERLAYSLYHFDINQFAILLGMNLRDLPPGASVGCSDESFYLLYAGRKRGFRMTDDPTGKEDYFIKLDEEAFPFADSARYIKRWDRGDFRVYQRQ